MATTALLTADQFANMITEENERYELVDGELIPVSSATPRHNIIKDKLAFAIRYYFQKNPIGGSASETDCRINTNTVRRPGLSIFVGAEWDQLDVNHAPVPFAPSIAVEVLSPSENMLDVNRKVRDYLSAGSKEVWLLDPANGELHVRTKAGIRLLQGSELLDSALLPGLSVNVAELFSSR